MKEILYKECSACNYRTSRQTMQEADQKENPRTAISMTFPVFEYACGKKECEFEDKDLGAFLGFFSLERLLRQTKFDRRLKR